MLNTTISIRTKTFTRLKLLFTSQSTRLNVAEQLKGYPMLTSIRHRGRIAFANSTFTWGADLDRIFEILSKYFDNFNDNGFYAHPDEIALRGELSRVGTLAHLTEGLRGLGAHGVVLSNLGLKDLPEERRNAALYALTLMLGYPTSTDQRTGRVAWNVKARPVGPDGGRFTTFSERVGNADMHTDSSFYPMPEEQFVLYVVHAARCGGGQSLIVDGDDIHAALQASEAGRSAFEVLNTTPVPFRVPAVYAAGDEQVEVHVAPVFGPPRRAGARFTLRWRHDSIQKGLAARPDLDTPALRAAIETMNEIIERGAARFEDHLADDTLMLIDNHHTLHGRTNYEDEARHLIRIRISDVPNAQRIGPSGVARD
jgi:alpha-ketoglutarate-dependent taurine dioxygenase